MDTPRLSVLIVLVALVAAGSAAALDRTLDVGLEIEEAGVNEHRDAGQFTCLESASGSGGDDPRCALEDTGRIHPAVGVVVMDSVYRSSLGLSNQRETLSDPQGRLGEQMGEGGTTVGGVTLPTPTGLAVGGDTNTHRDSGGELPDFILPGLGKFQAWYGWWNDLNGNGLLEYRDEKVDGVLRARPDNEWYPKPGIEILAWIEPGAHPGYAAHDRPGSAYPDFRYGLAGLYYESVGNGQHVFAGGSLLDSLRVASVSDPSLAPSEYGPFTARATSRVDIDRYAALLVGDLEALYEATLEPIVSPMGSPSFGSLVRSGGRLSNAPDATGTPVDGPLATVVGAAYGRYEHETEEGTQSTASGAHATFVERYAGWIDLLPRYGPAFADSFVSNSHVFPGEIPARSASGGLAAPPGYVSFEVRTGLWKDIDGDGWIGTAAAEPYEHGLRPHPDNYVETASEFFPHFVTSHGTASLPIFKITVTPDGSWGGVVANGAVFNDETPIVLKVRGVDRNPGVYRSDAIFLPKGTRDVAFTACTDTLGLTYEDPAVGTETATLSDCDVVDRLA